MDFAKKTGGNAQMQMRYSENCVYAIQTPIGVKIGFTSRLGDRLSALQKQHGVQCYPIALLTGLSRRKALDIEKYFHEKFAPDNVEYEIFDISPVLVIATFQCGDHP